MADDRAISRSGGLTLSVEDIERRKTFVGFSDADLARMMSIREMVTRHADAFVAEFFDVLAAFAEAQPLFRRPGILQEARRLKREHLLAMVAGEYGLAYAEQRIRLGMLYSSAGLDVRVFLGGFHHLMRAIGTRIMGSAEGDPMRAFDIFMSLKKLGFFDIGIIVDVLIAERERVIEVQQDAIRDLSTPTLRIRDRLLIVPIIGVVDSERARQLADNLLEAIRVNRAAVVVIDVTGVASIDQTVANHLIRTAAATRLMGAVAIITGLSAAVSQSLVTLGVDLSGITTAGDLQAGLERAERLLAAGQAGTERVVQA
jgi:rsbT co-antagonist protein RsbR